MAFQKNIIQNDWWTDNDSHFDTTRFDYGYNDMIDGHDVSEGPGFSKRNYIVNIKNIDEAIVQLDRMSQTVEIGKDALEELQSSVETLRSAWRGSDAKEHLTRLLIVKAFLGQFTSILYEVSKSMYYQLQDFSKRTEANQGSAYNLGSFHEIDFGDLFLLNSDITDTLEVFVNTEVATLALDKLKSSKNDFIEFSTRFFQLYSYILEIWVEGGKRETFENGFNNYQKNYQLFLDTFEKAISNLARAIEIWQSK